MVDRCVCKSVSFSRLKELADQGHSDLDALSKKTGCGTGCGMCVPYIRVVLATGRTNLPIMTSFQIEKFIATAAR